MIRRIAILGATGDLTARYLLPALHRLRELGRLPADLEVRGIAHDDWDTPRWREHAARALARHAGAVDTSTQRELLESLEFRRADVTDESELAAALDPGPEPMVVYLALPPGLLAGVVDVLTRAGLPAESRIVVEKPFGTDLRSAQHLNRRLHAAFPENAVFRIDHFLGKQTVQNVLGLRFANRFLEPLWNRDHIERVEVVWDETLGLEGRAGYYDTAGALRDMLQNHLLQLVSLIAMDAPASLDERDLRDRKVQVLRSVRRPADVEGTTIRARYVAGRAAGRELPDYTDEAGVDPARATETFAQITLFVDNWRWAGVPFVLRSGKALARDRHHITAQFREVPHLAFGQGAQPVPNRVRLEFDPDRVSLAVNVNGPGDPFDLECIELDAVLEPQDPPAYARLLLDVLEGDPLLSIRADEAEESWRICEPVLAAWREDRVPMREYPAGSESP
ncbi:MAG TPA: glucose-6-phosphate dehydrogenase [Acidimicrobiia bacterium]|nr:glucose-6-phosphate dehydrogenase [Acidimicrobiia bacterium]